MAPRKGTKAEDVAAAARTSARQEGFRLGYGAASRDLARRRAEDEARAQQDTAATFARQLLAWPRELMFTCGVVDDTGAHVRHIIMADLRRLADCYLKLVSPTGDEATRGP